MTVVFSMGGRIAGKFKPVCRGRQRARCSVYHARVCCFEKFGGGAEFPSHRDEFLLQKLMATKYPARQAIERSRKGIGGRPRGVPTAVIRLPLPPLRGVSPKEH
jgi:hypothetical protein